MRMIDDMMRLDEMRLGKHLKQHGDQRAARQPSELLRFDLAVSFK